MRLSLEKYKALEREGKKHLPNRFLEAFQPEVFNKVGFPTQIDDESEVVRFLDTMHDGRLKHYYVNLAMAPDAKEFEAIQKLSKDIYDFSNVNYGQGVVVKAPLLASAFCWRKLEALSHLDDHSKPKIFEIGGGGGR